MSKSTRDDFSSAVKEALAARAGYRCSFPGCDVTTIGPSTEGNLATSNTGMACHIAAAAGGPGARRYISSMTREQRCDVQNGIWMCYTHGKLIDTDDSRFTIEMLQKWREFAEWRAKFRQEYGADQKLPQDNLVNIGFADATISIHSLKGDVEAIANLLQDCCVPLVWGLDPAQAVRDVVVEVIRNAFIHGSASTCRLKVQKRAIYVEDDGTAYDWVQLRATKNARGGAAAVNQLFATYGDRLILGSKRVADRNQATIALAHSMTDVNLVTPCSTTISKGDLELIKEGKLESDWFSPAMLQCGIIYIVLPPFTPHSDAIRIADAIRPESIRNKLIMFVVRDASRGVREYLLNRFPDSRVLEVAA